MNKITTADTYGKFPLQRSEPIAIHRVLNLFEAGSADLLAHVAADLDFRIDHYRDETGVSWQTASNIQELGGVLQRLAEEVFPQGTRVLGLQSLPLGEGWFLTRFHQAFFYGVRQCDCESMTYILSHETEGKLDYFRETVTNVVSTAG